MEGHMEGHMEGPWRVTRRVTGESLGGSLEGHLEGHRNNHLESLGQAGIGAWADLSPPPRGGLLPPEGPGHMCCFQGSRPAPSWVGDPSSSIVQLTGSGPLPVLLRVCTGTTACPSLP